MEQPIYIYSLHHGHHGWWYQKHNGLLEALCSCRGGCVTSFFSPLFSFLLFSSPQHLFVFHILPKVGQTPSLQNAADRGGARCRTLLFPTLWSEKSWSSSPDAGKPPTDFKGRAASLKTGQKGLQVVPDTPLLGNWGNLFFLFFSSCPKAPPRTLGESQGHFGQQEKDEAAMH